MSPQLADKVAFVMVGLPARGKSFMARKIARYLSWLGHPARVFNVGSYRRERLGAQQRHSFFDPGNEAGNAARWALAAAALEDMLSWLEREGEVGLYDATNSSAERRALVRQECERRGVRVVFVESICNDPSVLEANIRQTKATSPDYLGVEAETAVEDFRQRIAHYERAYEPVHESEGSHVKVIDVGRTVVSHRIEGYVPARVVYFLLNLHIQPRTLWLTRHGQSEFNLEDRVGGDAPLTAAGQRYAEALGDFVRAQRSAPVVWTSTLRRTTETAERAGLAARSWRALDEIDAGLCDGLTYAEIEERMPAESAARAADKFRYRYPRGESYQDVIQRLEPVMLELERQRVPVLLVGHQAVLRALYAYLMGMQPESCPRLHLPLHTVVRLTPNAYGCEEQRYTLVPELAVHSDEPGPHTP